MLTLRGGVFLGAPGAATAWLAYPSQQVPGGVPRPHEFPVHAEAPRGLTAVGSGGQTTGGAHSFSCSLGCVWAVTRPAGHWPEGLEGASPLCTCPCGPVQFASDTCTPAHSTVASVSQGLEVQPGALFLMFT